MPAVKKSHAYVSPAGRVVYSGDSFQSPGAEVAVDVFPDRINPELVERFHALVEELTGEMMSAGSFDRASCRADAIALLTAASDRLHEESNAPESPLKYLLMEERMKAEAALNSSVHSRQELSFLKV